MPTPSLSNWLSILALGLIWGGSFAVVSIALEGFGPVTVACARTTLGAITLLAIMRAMGKSFPRLTSGLLVYLVPAGLLSTAVPFLLLSWGQQHVASAFAGISMASVPLFVLPLAHFFSDERMTHRALAGVCLGFLGAAILIGPGLLNLSIDANPIAQLACISAAFCYASASIFTRQCPPIDPVVLAAASLIFGSAMLIPMMFLLEGPPKVTETRATLAIIFLGFVPTALATLLRVAVIRSAGSVFMTLVNYQVPVWSMLFGAWILSEVLPVRFFLALCLIMSGVAVSQWPNLRKLFS